ncbi:lipopolysaccharide biosynthesis protein RfbH [Paracoccaceae bacterium]|nr:lipopolysaccharide biosynthesis protein RfbH [Paracoccaceae bacterium]
MNNEIELLVDKYFEANRTDNRFVPGETLIPPSGKVIGRAERINMIAASLDGWLTAGRFNDEFEQKLSNFLGVKSLITVNSGSSANLVAFSTLTSSKLGKRAIKQGDEVISVAAGFPTTINPILQFGAIPVFVDIDLSTYNIRVDDIEAAITPKTRAIMLAHTLGNPFNLEVIQDICKKHNLWLIEDCCDALGSTFQGKKVGTFGDIGTLSFYPAHHITMGEGGAVFTNNKKLAKIAESFRDWGRDCYCPAGVDNTCNNRFCWTAKKLGGSLPDGFDHKYTYGHCGYNLKITDMQAACGLAQLDRLSGFIQKRKENFEYFLSRMQETKDYFALPTATENSEPSWFGFPLTIKPETGLDRNKLLLHLDTKKIGTRLLFAGNVTRQPYMAEAKYRVHGELVNTENVMHNTFWTGIWPGVTSEMLDYIADTIHEFVMSEIKQ